MITPRVLVVDDDSEFVKNITQLLSDKYCVEGCSTPEQALALLMTKMFHVVLLDLIYEPTKVKSSYADGGGGVRALRAIRAHEVPVIVISRTEDFHSVIEVQNEGAFHFVPRETLRKEVLCNLIDKAIANASYERELTYQRAACVHVREGMFCRSSAMQQVVALADRYARTDAPILITGEMGSGKNTIAKAIHAASGRTRRYEEKLLNSFSPELLAGELFGSEPGAFTGAVKRAGILEVANGGTVLLDEIADLPEQYQVQLLQVVEQKKVCRLGSTVELPIDVRFLFATNQPIERMAREGKFRRDLYYRISALRIHVPPLRERTEDLLDIAWHTISVQRGRRRRFTPDALDWLLEQPWFGNVRELQNIVTRAYHTAEEFHYDDELLSALDLRRAWVGEGEEGVATGPSSLYPMPTDDLARLACLPPERLVPWRTSEKLLTDALHRRLLGYGRAREPRSKDRAAKVLGVSRETLYQWMRELDYRWDDEGQLESEGVE